MLLPSARESHEEQDPIGVKREKAQLPAVIDLQVSSSIAGRACCTGGVCALVSAASLVFSSCLGAVPYSSDKMREQP